MYVVLSEVIAARKDTWPSSLPPMCCAQQAASSRLFLTYPSVNYFKFKDINGVCTTIALTNCAGVKQWTNSSAPLPKPGDSRRLMNRSCSGSWTRSLWTSRPDHYEGGLHAFQVVLLPCHGPPLPYDISRMVKDGVILNDRMIQLR